MKTIYISCPANSYTGGPTLAHQLCRTLNDSGFHAKMFYYGRNTRIEGRPVVHPNYINFHNDYVFEVPDNENSIIIAVETYTTLLAKYKKAIKVIWWMSVDNFYMCMGSQFDIILNRLKLYHPTMEHCKKNAVRKKYQLYKSKEIIHLAQSEYAKQFLLDSGIEEDRIFRLSDFLEDTILENADKNAVQSNRKQRVLYNPKKGYEFTQKIIQASSNLEWVPLINLTKEQMMNEFYTSIIYIDFGNHPGKDRIPREAVISGCCLITGRRGAANNAIDINIPEKYKFSDTEENIPQICQMIEFMLNHYETCNADFDSYRDIIKNEKKIFVQDAIDIFSKITES